ncbi:MAG: hypothetical protein HFI86_01350 [Bacilli bacterium]|nr:hypothetical protein [Bacilli bacterium]
MKKVVSIMAVIATFFMFGNKNVNALEKTYWEKFFEERYSDGIGYGEGGCSSSTNGLHNWGDVNRTFHLEYGGCGDATVYLEFQPVYYTDNVIFNDVENVTVKSSDETIITGEVKAYDFSKEKEAFNNYIKWYNELTFDEFKGHLINAGHEDWAASFKEKPIWWLYNGYESEPTWWTMYGFMSEPTKAVEVITYAKDLGNATLTVSAKDKEDIHINWTMDIEYIEPDGIVQILNNLERYKDIIKEREYYVSDKKENYTFMVASDNNLSSLINTLKGKDIKLLFNNYSEIGETNYILNGQDITNTVSEGFTYESKISMETSINKDKINSLTELKDAIYIDFTYHGILPTTYKLNVNVEEYIVGSFVEQLGCEQYSWDTDPENYTKCWSDVWNKAHEYFENTTFDLLYYNPETEKMEVVTKGLKAKDGFVVLEFDHFSSYVLVANGNYTITNKPKAPNNAQTSSMNVYLYIGVALVSLVGISYLLIKKSKKKIA